MRSLVARVSHFEHDVFAQAPLDIDIPLLIVDRQQRLRPAASYTEAYLAQQTVRAAADRVIAGRKRITETCVRREAIQRGKPWSAARERRSGVAGVGRIRRQPEKDSVARTNDGFR